MAGWLAWHLWWTMANLLYWSPAWAVPRVTWWVYSTKDLRLHLNVPHLLALIWTLRNPIYNKDLVVLPAWGRVTNWVLVCCYHYSYRLMACSITNCCCYWYRTRRHSQIELNRLQKVLELILRTATSNQVSVGVRIYSLNDTKCCMCSRTNELRAESLARGDVFMFMLSKRDQSQGTTVQSLSKRAHC